MGSRVLDLACGTGDLCRELSGHRYGRSGSTSRSACWPRPDTRCAARAGRRARGCPVPDASVDGVTCGFALRNFVDLGGVLRRAGPGRAPARPRRAARGGRAAFPRAPLRATASTSARSCPASAGSCPTAAPTATCPSRWPISRHPTRCSTCLRDAGFDAVERRTLSGGIAQLLARPRAPHGSRTVSALRAVTPPTRRRRRPGRRGRRRRRAVDRGQAPVWPGRGEALRIEVPRLRPRDGRQGRARRARPHRGRRRVGLPGSGPVAIGALPFDPSNPARSSCPSCSSAAARTAPDGSPRSAPIAPSRPCSTLGDRPHP